jgi:biopolymer transport protein ExbD
MAGSLGGGDDDGIIAEINVTPFVDVVLVLLVIFMVTSAYIVKAAIQVDLPKAASAGDSVESTLNIVITKEGDLLLNGEPTNREQLAAYVRSEVKREPGTQAVIAADKLVVYGEVSAVIDIVKLGGVKSFALNLERAPKPAQ